MEEPQAGQLYIRDKDGNWVKYAKQCYIDQASYCMGNGKFFMMSELKSRLPAVYKSAVQRLS